MPLQRQCIIILFLFICILIPNITANECFQYQTITVPSTITSSTLNQLPTTITDCSSSRPVIQSKSGQWFKIRTEINKSLLISTCGSCFDTIIHIYQSNCNILQCVEYNDDSREFCTNSNDYSCVQFNSLISSSSICTTQEEYLIFVTGYGEARGDITLKVEYGGPCIENDKCELATALDISSYGPSLITESFTNVAAMTDFVNCGYNILAHAVWYTYFGYDGLISARICSTTPHSLELSLYSGFVSPLSLFFFLSSKF